MIRARRISTGEMVRRSRSIIVRSASMPVAIMPFSRSCKCRQRSRARVHPQGFLDRDLLRRHPAVGMLVVERPASDGGVDAFEGGWRRDEPVAAKRHHRLVVEQRPERIRRFRCAVPRSPCRAHRPSSIASRQRPIRERRNRVSPSPIAALSSRRDYIGCVQ